LFIKKYTIAFLFIIASAGFSLIDKLDLSYNFSFSKVEAAKRNRKTTKKSTKVESKKDIDDKATKNDESGLLPDNDKAISYMPDIYRCPECGYEQDESGFCPDHATIELIKIISNPNDPLAPAELDGNEDILVDIPLNIQFKKDELESKKSLEDSKKEKSEDKSKKKNKTKK
jgi:hypothetical protein